LTHGWGSDNLRTIVLFIFALLYIYNYITMKRALEEKDAGE